MTRARALALAFSAALAGAAWWTLHTRSAEASSSRSRAEAELRGRDITFYETRVVEDPQSAADLAQLAGLYLQRGRETGALEDLMRAEEAARRSLALREARNGKARLVLASSLLARHRFPEALAEAEHLCHLQPDESGYCALLGEIQLEMGDYDAARATFGALASARGNLAVAPRLARWTEITGATESARRILYTALEETKRRPDLPREQVVWFYLRVGDLELRTGRLGVARNALEEGLGYQPHDRRLLAAMARLEALQGRWKSAIRYGRRAVERVPDPATLALIGDAYAALGDAAAATEYYDAVERLAVDAPEPFNRAWTLFRLDHGRKLHETVALLQQEIKTRRDVYGYDQLAWGRYQLGDYATARSAMLAALRMNTRDAVLWFHAGMIEAALGSHDAARRHLAMALEANPYFHHTFPAVARATLERLQTGSNAPTGGSNPND